jgi:hypothetical protein
VVPLSISGENDDASITDVGLEVQGRRWGFTRARFGRKGGAKKWVFTRRWQRLFKASTLGRKGWGWRGAAPHVNGGGVRSSLTDRQVVLGDRSLVTTEAGGMLSVAI